MDDLIKRQDALVLIDWYDHQYSEIESYLDIIREDIKSLPSAQKTGRWIHDGKDFPHGNDWIHCSVCGKLGINVPADLTNYCPNCGSRMEVED